jgi:CheY-like chemotaxis protein
MVRLQTILVVDDESELRKIIVMTLTELGFKVLTASDGYTAIRILADRNVELLLTDIRMPGMNGYELACLLLDWPRFGGAFSHIPVPDCRREDLAPHKSGVTISLIDSFQ